jgi:hypothetical protein
MTRPPNSGPGDHDALSSWDRHVLAGIEHDLAASDPRLAHEMRRRESGPAPRWWPLSARSTGLLVLALTVLVPVGALLPASWWAVLGLLTTLFVVPSLLLAALENSFKNYPENDPSD